MQNQLYKPFNMLAHSVMYFNIIFWIAAFPGMLLIGRGREESSNRMMLVVIFHSLNKWKEKY